MSRSKLTQAPISLITSGPRRTPELFGQLGRLFNLARSSAPDPKATLDAAKCPTCGADVEWAETVKYGAVQSNGKPEQLRYAYARCKANGAAHRWGFKAANPNAPAPSAKPPEARPTPPPAPSAVPPPPKSPPPSTHADNPFAAFETWLEGRIGARLDNAEAVIRDLSAKATPDPKAIVEAIRSEIMPLIEGATRNLTITTPVQTIKVNGMHHPVLDEMLERYALGQRAFLLVGPAGTGKTTIAIQFARAIGAARHSVIAMSEQAREETLRGYRNAMTNVYVPSAVVEDLCESLTAPAVTTLEEIDGSNPNTLLLINTLENGFLSTPDADVPECHRGADHVLIATANTYGHAGSNVYVGRNQLDAATLNRYACLFVDYDTRLEKAIVGDDEVCTLARAIRSKAESQGIRKVFSTRDAKRLVFDRQLTKNKGKALPDVAKAYLASAGWVAAEIGRVLA